MSVVGIDLGTTNSCIAAFNNSLNKVEIIPNEMGKETTPSIVAFKGNGEITVGINAKNQMINNPKNTVYGIKRLIGYKYNDEDIQEDIKNWPFEVVSGNLGRAAVQVMNGSVKKTYTPEEISSFILIKMKSYADKQSIKKYNKAVITVPAYFNSSQRQSTKNAGMIAGFDVLGIISEPTAAAIAYGVGEKGLDQKVFIFDFGGGTFDCTIMHVHDGVFDVIATGGNVHLGGEDIDMLLVEHFANQFKKSSGIDIMKDDKYARQRMNLKLKAEEMKIELSVKGVKETSKTFPNFIGNGKDFVASITLKTFNYLCDDILSQINDCLDEVFDNTAEKLGVDSVDPKTFVNSIIMVGGSSKNNFVIEAVNSYFEKKPLFSISPDTAVAYGAAVYANSIQLYKEGNFSSAKRPKDDNGNYIVLVDPNALNDVVPLSLGIETRNSAMDVLIKNNTTVPVSQTRRYITVEDDECAWAINVYEGQRVVANENRKLGSFIISFPKKPAGQVQVDVTFSVDKENIVTVTAKEVGGGSFNSIQIKNDVGNLTNEDIEKMKREADAFREADRKRVETCEALNEFDSMLMKASRKAESSSEAKRIIEEAKQWKNRNEQASGQVIRNKMKEYITNLQKYITF